MPNRQFIAIHYFCYMRFSVVGAPILVDGPRSLDEFETKAVTPETKVRHKLFLQKITTTRNEMRWHDKMTFFRLEMYSFVKFTLPLSTKGRNGRMVERKKIEIPRNRNV